jgi:uncharacterized protein YbaP (TraB family)
MKKRIVYLFLLLFAQGIKAQDANSLLWEISGNGLKSPSWLFGTYHLITSSFIDSFPLILNKLDSSKLVAGEIIMDVEASGKVARAVIMKDSTLPQLMSKSDYELTAAYLREINGMNLALFDKMKPVVISTFIYSALLPKINPGEAMDIYFQDLARKKSKKLIGLESIDDQISVLFEGVSLKRQADMLVKLVKEKDKGKEATYKLNDCYRRQDLNCLASGLDTDTGFDASEMEHLLYQRNRNWMKILPGLLREQSCFIAVGAGHLPGDKGLLELLRKQGYTVTPLLLSH